MTETADINVRSLLESARRAEADGNHDAAARAFRHITENYPRTPEARIAADALARRAARPASGLTLPIPPPVPVRAGATRPVPPAPPQDRSPQPHPVAAQVHAPRSPVPHAPAAHAQPRPHGRIHPPRYRFGRAIAFITGLIGGAILLAAIFAALLNLGATFGYVTAPAIASMLIGWPLILVTNAIGLLLVLFSQMARATFDAADAARGNTPH